MENHSNQAPFTYLIYPPGELFSFKWGDLSVLFLSPDNYGLGRELPGLASLGYTVSKEDHQLVSGVGGGGGIIQVRRAIKRWFPAVLLRTQCTFEIPPGFPMHSNTGCSVMVPKILPEHKLGIEAIPSCPAPYFSIEPSEQKYLFILGYSGRMPTMDELKAGSISQLGLDLRMVESLPECFQAQFEKIQNKRLNYAFYELAQLPEVEIDPQKLLAAGIYLGLFLVRIEKVRLKRLHFFYPSFAAKFEYPSATRWTGSLRGVVSASDW